MKGRVIGAHTFEGGVLAVVIIREDSLRNVVTVPLVGVESLDVLKERILERWTEVIARDALAAEWIRALQGFELEVGQEPQPNAPNGGAREELQAQRLGMETAPDGDLHKVVIERLLLAPRVRNSLRRANISTVGQVLEIPDLELLKIKNFAERSLDELKKKLLEFGQERRQAQEAGWVPNPWRVEGAAP